MAATLLVVHHSPSASLGRLTEAALEGARHPDIKGVTVRPIEAVAFARAARPTRRTSSTQTATS